MSNNNCDFETLKFIETYEPLLKKYTRKLNYDDAQSDLCIFLLELYNKLPEFNLPAQKTVYVSTCMKNEYIKLSKSNQKISQNEVHNDIALDSLSVSDYDALSLDLKLAFSVLSSKERSTINLLYFKGFKEIDIANHQNISKQAVNNTKKRALSKLADKLKKSYFID